MNRDVISQAWAAACVACPDFRDLLEAQPQWNQSMQQETATAVNSILTTQTSTCPILPEKRCSTQCRTSAPSTSASSTWEMEQNSSSQPDTIPLADLQRTPKLPTTASTGPNAATSPNETVASQRVEMPPPVAPAPKRPARSSRSRPRSILPKPPAASPVVTSPIHTNTPATAAATAASSQIVLPPALITDPFLCIQDTFDNLIATQIQNPPNSTSTSSLALRRFLFRKLFCEHAFKELQALTVPVTSVDQLIPIISSACTKSGLLLM